MPALDPTGRRARSTLERMQRDLQVHGKMIQAAKRRDGTLRQFIHARALAFPGGLRRAQSGSSFLNQWPRIVNRLDEELPLIQAALDVTI